MEYTTEDEARIIVALGIVGSVLAYFALAAGKTGQGLLPIVKCDPNTVLISIAYQLIYIVVAFFGVYLILITMSLAFSVLPKLSNQSYLPKDSADLFFAYGAFTFVAFAFSVLFYALYENQVCNGASTVVTTIPFFLAFTIAIFLTSLLLAKKWSRPTFAEQP